MPSNTFMFVAPKDKPPQIGMWHRIVVLVPGDLNTAMQFLKSLPGYDAGVVYQSTHLGQIPENYGPAVCCYMDVREAPKGGAAPEEGSEFAGNQFAGGAF